MEMLRFHHEKLWCFTNKHGLRIKKVISPTKKMAGWWLIKTPLKNDGVRQWEG